MLIDLFSVGLHETVKLFSKAFLPEVLFPAHNVTIRVEIVLSRGIVVCELTALVEGRCGRLRLLDLDRVSRRSLILCSLSDQLLSLLLHLLQIGQLSMILFAFLGGECSERHLDRSWRLL